MDKLLDIEACKTLSCISKHLALLVCEPTWYCNDTTINSLSVRHLLSVKSKLPYNSANNLFCIQNFFLIFRFFTNLFANNFISSVSPRVCNKIIWNQSLLLEFIQCISIKLLSKYSQYITKSGLRILATLKEWILTIQSVFRSYCQHVLGFPTRCCVFDNTKWLAWLDQCSFHKWRSKI